VISRVDVRWFAERAGGIVGRCWTGALHLARAEVVKHREGWKFEWSFDDCASIDDHADHAVWCPEGRQAAHERRRPDCNHEILQVIATDRAGAFLGSLGAIIDPDGDYVRIVEAEIAAEAIAERAANAVTIAG
jgi:hypothetical protein